MHGLAGSVPSQWTALDEHLRNAAVENLRRMLTKKDNIKVSKKQKQTQGIDKWVKEPLDEEQVRILDQAPLAALISDDSEPITNYARVRRALASHVIPDSRIALVYWRAKEHPEEYDASARNAHRLLEQKVLDTISELPRQVQKRADRKITYEQKVKQAWTDQRKEVLAKIDELPANQHALHFEKAMRTLLSGEKSGNIILKNVIRKEEGYASLAGGRGADFHVPSYEPPYNTMQKAWTEYKRQHNEGNTLLNRMNPDHRIPVTLIAYDQWIEEKREELAQKIVQAGVLKYIRTELADPFELDNHEYEPGHAPAADNALQTLAEIYEIEGTDIDGIQAAARSSQELAEKTATIMSATGYDDFDDLAAQYHAMRDLLDQIKTQLNVPAAEPDGHILRRLDYMSKSYALSNEMED